MSENRDPYDVLGVARDASPGDIKKAYRALARTHHPDVRPDDPASEARFKSATAAYEVLSDPERRALYDEFGEESMRQGFDPELARRWRDSASVGGAGFEGVPPGFEGFGFDVGDLFGDLFGSRGPARARAPQRGADLRAGVRISFEDAALGALQELRFEDGRALKVNLPAGVEDGEVLRLKGKGAEGPAGPGDLLLTVHVRAHARYAREGLDVTASLPLTVAEASLGATVRVETLHGPLDVRVPAGVRSGQRLRLRGKGIARKGRPVGDMFVRLEVHAPKVDVGDERVREALEILDGAYASHPRGEGARRAA